MSHRIELVQVSTITVGDTIMVDGIERTVCKRNLGRSLLGPSVFGDSYSSGKKLVEKVIFPQFYRGVRVN